MKLLLVDDCLSAHSCNTGDGEPKICNDPPAIFDATVAISAIGADGSFTVWLDLGDGSVPRSCPPRRYEVCIDDGEHRWCGERTVAACSDQENVLVYGVCSDTACTTYIELRNGEFASECNDVWVGTVVP